MSHATRRIVSQTVSRGFTLIELLVVITIISLLISILLPALGQAKKTAKMLVEQAAGKQQITSWTSYTYDYKSGVIIPYIHWTWAHPNPGPIQVRSKDTFNYPSANIEGDVMKVWPLRFAYYAGNLPVEALYNDKAMLSTFQSRNREITGGNPNAVAPIEATTLYDDTARYQYALGWHTSFGINSVFFGGHYRRGAFPNGTGGDVGHPRNNQGGHFYASKVDDVRFPSTLMTFTTSRSVDVSTTSRGTIGYGGSFVPWTTASTIIPGYYEVTPPRVTGIPLTGGTLVNWIASNTFDKRSNPISWGGVDARHFNKAISIMADSHVETLKVEQLRDMRRWSNKATRPDWQFGQP